MKQDEFYIGWMPKSPTTFARHIKKVLIAMAVAVLTAGIVLAISQKKFGTGTFEFGRLTEIKGIFYSTPVPLLKVSNGNDLFGRPSFITVPLIGYGKSGAGGVITAIEKQEHISLDKREVVLKGTLLYNDGKLLMQIDANDHFLVRAEEEPGNSGLPKTMDLGEQTIKGEIVDPKCFFGVMKPGEGKPHKDCAIRCILGGIPPVLKVTDEYGKQNYYILVGPNGEQINEIVKDFVAEPVSVSARVKKCDDWIILYVHDKGLERYSYLEEHFKNDITSCSLACSK
jgi:hypothetical protein